MKQGIKMTDKNANKIGYKKTKLGWIPEDWEMVRFEELFDEVINLSNDTDTYPLYSLTLENGVTPKTERYERSHLLKDKEENEFKLISKGQIAINPMNLRFGAFFISKVPNTVSLSAYYDIVKAKNDSVNTLFYDAFMKSAPAKRLYQQIATGSLDEKKRVHLSELNKQLVPYPRKKEQEKIAEVLSCWDDGIEVLEKLLEKKQLHKKALEQMLFNEKKSWQLLRFDSIFKDYCKKNCPDERLLSATQENGVIPRDMLNSKVMSPDGTLSGYKLIDIGDFVISLRSFQGGIEYSNYRGILSPAYTVLKSIMEINKDFYKYFFKSYRFIEKYLSISVIGIRDGKQISYSDLSSVKIPYPPIDEQQKIAKVLNNCDEEIRLLGKKLEMLKQQKKGLMQKLLTGEIRVKI